MALNYTAPSFSGGIPSGIALSNAFADIETVLRDVVSRSGQLPNAMEVDLDMNGHDLLNVGSTGGRLLTADDIQGLASSIAIQDTRITGNTFRLGNAEADIRELDARIDVLDNVDLAEDLTERMSSLETTQATQNASVGSLNGRVFDSAIDIAALQVAVAAIETAGVGGTGDVTTAQFESLIATQAQTDSDQTTAIIANRSRLDALGQPIQRGSDAGKLNANFDIPHIFRVEGESVEDLNGTFIQGPGFSEKIGGYVSDSLSFSEVAGEVPSSETLASDGVHFNLADRTSFTTSPTTGEVVPLSWTRGAIYAADYSNGARWDDTTPNENRAALVDVINRAATTSGINKIILPYGAEASISGRLDIPDNLEIDWNSSVLKPTNATLADFIVINGSNVEMYGGAIEATEGALQRLIRTADTANDVYLHDMSASGNAGISALTGLEDEATTTIALVRTGAGSRIYIDKLQANNIENVVDIDGTQEIYISKSRGTMMGGSPIWIAGGADGVYIDDFYFNTHMLGRVVNNAIACEGESNGSIQRNVYVRGGTLQGRPNTPHDTLLKNGASGDLIAIRATHTGSVDGVSIYDSGEYGIDAVHGTRNFKIINNHIERSNICAITAGSVFNAGEIQSRTENTYIAGNTCIDSGLDLDNSVNDGTIPAIRVYNANLTTIGPNHIENSEVGIGYRDATNNVVHPQTMVNVGIPSTSVNEVTFLDPTGTSFQDEPVVPEPTVLLAKDVRGGGTHTLSSDDFLQPLWANALIRLPVLPAEFVGGVVEVYLHRFSEVVPALDAGVTLDGGGLSQIEPQTRVNICLMASDGATSTWKIM